MKKIIICGSTHYVQRITNEINVVATIVGQAPPTIISETRDSRKLLEHAKTERFPIFILDKMLPTLTSSWLESDAFNVASEIRRVRNESVEQYSLPNKQKAFIILFSKEGYSMTDRGAMDRFWSPNIFLKEDRDATESEVSTLAVGTQVFNGAWMLPEIATELHDKFVTLAR